MKFILLDAVVSCETLNRILFYVVIIVVFGALGGLVGHFIRREGEEGDSVKGKKALGRSIVIGIGAAFLVPLFLQLIDSQYISEEIELKNVMMVIAFCVLTSIYSKRFISAISQKLMDKIDELEKETSKVREENRETKGDQAAILAVERHLDRRDEDVDMDPAERQQADEQLKDMIKNATVAARALIFRHARRYRKTNKDNDKVSSVFPIFEALIQSDADKKYHRNHAQIGYAQKEHEPPLYEQAKVSFDQAIAVRDAQQVKGYRIYNFSRAICAIMTDQQYKQGAPSGEPQLSQIKNDLIEATTSKIWDELNKRKKAGKVVPGSEDDHLFRWMELNEFNWSKDGAA